MVIPTPDSTREELLEGIRNLNARAKAMSRRGMTATLTDAYGDLHDNLSWLVDELRARDATEAVPA